MAMVEQTVQSVPEVSDVWCQAEQTEHADGEEVLLQEPVGYHVPSSGSPSQCDREYHTSNMSQVASDV